MKKAIIVPNYLKAESMGFCKVAKEMLENIGYDIEVMVENDMPSSKADFALVLGGDGTILRACKKLYKYDIPVFGINFGNIGYLTGCNPDTAVECINKVVSGEYKLENRLMIEGEVIRKDEVIHSFVALNEVTLFRSTLKKAFKTELYINGLNTQTILGDGVIIATPTGSTSYNLSAGGPVLTPESNNMVITPVSPMQFLHTSIVTGGNDTIELKVKINSLLENATISLEIDGDSSMEIYDGDMLRIKRAENTAKTIKVNDISFYQILRQKLSKVNE
ncbi:MAG: NAD(+)/NADH kinase [Clostridia bacterium]|nr:NAD(+)/NADH kinase [Clostridia bacterium]